MSKADFVTNILQIWVFGVAFRDHFRKFLYFGFQFVTVIVLVNGLFVLFFALDKALEIWLRLNKVCCLAGIEEASEILNPIEAPLTVEFKTFCHWMTNHCRNYNLNSEHRQHVVSYLDYQEGTCIYWTNYWCYNMFSLWDISVYVQNGQPSVKLLMFYDSIPIFCHIDDITFYRV